MYETQFMDVSQFMNTLPYLNRFQAVPPASIGSNLITRFRLSNIKAPDEQASTPN